MANLSVTRVQFSGYRGRSTAWLSSLQETFASNGVFAAAIHARISRPTRRYSFPGRYGTSLQAQRSAPLVYQETVLRQYQAGVRPRLAVSRRPYPRPGRVHPQSAVWVRQTVPIDIQLFVPGRTQARFARRPPLLVEYRRFVGYHQAWIFEGPGPGVFDAQLAEAIRPRIVRWSGSEVVVHVSPRRVSVRPEGTFSTALFAGIKGRFRRPTRAYPPPPPVPPQPAWLGATVAAPAFDEAFYAGIKPRVVVVRFKPEWRRFHYVAAPSWITENLVVPFDERLYAGVRTRVVVPRKAKVPFMFPRPRRHRGVGAYYKVEFSSPWKTRYRQPPPSRPKWAPRVRRPAAYGWLDFANQDLTNNGVYFAGIKPRLMAGQSAYTWDWRVPPKVDWIESVLAAFETDGTYFAGIKPRLMAGRSSYEWFMRVPPTIPWIEEAQPETFDNAFLAGIKPRLMAGKSAYQWYTRHPRVDPWPKEGVPIIPPEGGAHQWRRHGHR